VKLKTGRTIWPTVAMPRLGFLLSVVSFMVSAEFYLGCLTLLMFVETILGQLCGRVLPANLSVALPWSCELCGTAPVADFPWADYE